MNGPDYERLTEGRRALVRHLTERLPPDIGTRTDVYRALTTAFNCGFDTGLMLANKSSADDR